MTKGRERSRRRPWLLSLIVAGLLGSGLLRIGEGRAAFAEVVNPEGAAAETTGTFPVSGQMACAAKDMPEAMLLAIRSREEHLDAREAKLEDRMQALKIAEMKLAENTEALIAAEEKLAATLAIADSAAENDLARLTLVYESMKPKNAAGLFSEMAPEFAAGFLGRMRSDAAAAVLSSLDPARAYTISLILAGRNARAPSQ